MMYAVVTFTSESNDSMETVSEVPITWLSKDQHFCKWPSNNAHIYISKNRPPADDWPQYPAKVLHMCETLSEAKQKLHSIQSSSSDERERGRGHRILKTRNYFSPDDFTQSQKSKRVGGKNDRVSPPPYQKIVYKSTARQDDVVTRSSDVEEISEDNFTYQIIDSFTRPSVNVLNNDSASSTPVPSDNIRNLDENESEIITTPNSDLKCQPCEANCKLILNAMAEQTLLIRDLIERVSALDMPPKNPRTKFSYKVPCINLEELEHLELYLADEEQYEIYCDYIRKIGGDGSKDFVLRFMRTIFSNGTGELCSWTGAKSNFALKELKIMKAAYNTIMEVTGITLKEFETCVKEWLRHCKQRRLREEQKQ